MPVIGPGKFYDCQKGRICGRTKGNRPRKVIEVTRRQKGGKVDTQIFADKAGIQVLL